MTRPDLPDPPRARLHSGKPETAPPEPPIGFFALIPWCWVSAASEGSSALALPVRMTGGGFDQAGADRVLDNKPVDLR
jgi:hypothetical protein